MNTLSPCIRHEPFRIEIDGFLTTPVLGLDFGRICEDNSATLMRRHERTMQDRVSAP